MNDSLARPRKLSHGQTILYEIDMLRFSAKTLLHDKPKDEVEWMFLENFLLHYRNLVDFLGDPKPRADELHISKPEFSDGRPPDPAAVTKLRDAGYPLWENAETGSGIISQYLHHSTTERIIAKDWPIGTMNNGIEPLLADVESLLTHVQRLWQAQSGVQFDDRASNHTATVTRIQVFGEPFG